MHKRRKKVWKDWLQINLKLALALTPSLYWRQTNTQTFLRNIGTWKKHTSSSLITLSWCWIFGNLCFEQKSAKKVSHYLNGPQGLWFCIHKMRQGDWEILVYIRALKIHSHLCSTTTLGTPNFWLSGVRCSEVALCKVKMGPQMVVVVGRWSLAQVWRLKSFNE